MIKPNHLVRNIHIGAIINEVIQIKKISIDELKIKMGCTTRILNKYLDSKTMDSSTLLKWSKVLKYDFFRLYSSHLMLHHGISNTLSNKMVDVQVEGIHIRKNVYTKELIEFLVNKVNSKEMSISQVISTYGIPKTTFYKWLQKYSKE
jgi:hypothetical protein